MTTLYQQWIQVAHDLGYEGEELKSFVKDRQAEAKEERLIEGEEKKTQIELAEKRRAEEQNEKRHLAEMEFAEKRRAEEHDEKRHLAEMELAEKRRAEEQDEKRHLAEMELAEKRRLEEREDKQRENELELRRLEMQSQKEIKMRELELRMTLEATQQENRHENGGVRNSNNTGQNNNAKYVKMPVFKEERDCLDAYLVRFERTCQAYNVPADLWALTLVRSLDGKALEVYQKMDIEEAQDYEKLKQQLLRRFKLTEGGYRQKFKQCQKEKDESVAEYVERLKRYLKLWLQMSGFEQSYEGLETLILRDQFFVRCDNDLRRFLKEKGKIDLSEMIVQAQNYNEAQESDEHRVTTIKIKDVSHKDYRREVETEDMEGPRETQERGRGNRDFNTRGQFKSNWKFQGSRKHGDLTERQRGGCWKCGSKDHQSFSCNKRDQRDKTHTIAMMNCVEEDTKREDEVLISYYDVQDDHGNYCDIGDKNEFVSLMTVNNNEVQSFYDTGSSYTAVKKEWVRSDQYTGRHRVCVFMNGMKGRYPTAIIELAGKEFTGKAEAIVIENLSTDLIVGPQLYRKALGVSRHEMCDASVGTRADDVIKEVTNELTHEKNYLLSNSMEMVSDKDGVVDKQRRFNLRSRVESKRDESPKERIIAGNKIQQHVVKTAERAVKPLVCGKQRNLNEKTEEELCTIRTNQVKNEISNKTKYVSKCCDGRGSQSSYRPNWRARRNAGARTNWIRTAWKERDRFSNEFWRSNYHGDNCVYMEGHVKKTDEFQDDDLPNKREYGKFDRDKGVPRYHMDRKW